MNKHLHKFFFIPFFLISILLLLGAITTCVCTTVEKGKKVPVYLTFDKDVNTADSTNGFNPKIVYSSQDLAKAQAKQKIASYQINLLKKIFIVANHQWFFLKNPDYKATKLYKHLNQKINASTTQIDKKEKKTIENFLKAYLSKKNNSFKYVLVFLEGWKNSLVVNKEFSFIENFLFTKTESENKATTTTKNVNLPKLVFQFTNRWRIFLNIENITIKINKKQTFTVNGKTYYQSNFASLKKAKLNISQIVDLNS